MYKNTSESEREASLKTVLAEKIGDESLSFADFMRIALYDPAFGYYNAPEFTIGKDGDFTTAPLISPLFAQCFAEQIKELFAATPHYILEIGAGSGHFAKDVIEQLAALDALPAQYFIYDVSPTLIEKQKALCQALAPELLSRITWLRELPEKFTGIIIANEVFDALPFQCFCIEENTIKERRVALRDGAFTWQHHEPDAAFSQQVKRLYNQHALYSGYASEIHFEAEAFISRLLGFLTRGFLLIADYGYSEAEYYHPERSTGTLTCFYQHQRHDNPLIRVGRQDITAHVNFTRLLERALAEGAELAGYTTQADFLLDCGLLNLATDLENEYDPKEAFRLHQAIKQLVMPMEMGERVKVAAICKGISDHTPLIGFQHDRRQTLGGD